MFFISGITGNVGGAAASSLIERGRAVRALVRDAGKASAWVDRGVEIFQGDLDDSDAVTNVLKGVEGAFLMMPPIFSPADGYPEARVTAASFQKALRISLPPRLVLLSSFGSEQTSGLGNITSTHILETALSDLPTPTVFLRPGSFVENYAYGLEQAASTGFFDTFLTPTDRKVPMAATADIGKVVADLLVDDWTGKRIIELGTRYSADDLAGAFGTVLERSIQARAIPRDQWSKTLEYMGVPTGRGGSFEELMDGINSGWIDFGAAAEHIKGSVTPVEVFSKAHSSGRP